MNKYQIIYCDPPWTYNDKGNAGKRGASHKYNCMSFAELCLLPVKNIAADNCLLAMWWTGPMAVQAIQLAGTWGFTLKTMTGFSWHKQTKKGANHFGMGHWTRANVENVLFAIKGKPKRVNAGVSQFISTPIREHSRKPDEVRDHLVQLMGDIPRVELFARQRVDGWSAFGDEIEGSIVL